MKIFVIFFLCFNWIFLTTADGNFTFSFNMVQRCKEHISRHGYSYDTFHRVDSNEQKPQADEAILEMHIAILAGSNGHILLSTIPYPNASDPVYEIVVGGGANKFTELRRNLRRNARISAKTIGILSTIEFRPFYIKISEDGLVEFGKEGDNLPLLSYNDVNPLPIKYFSFASWNGVEAKFLYDCPAPNDNRLSPAPDSKEVEPRLSNSDKLKRSLLLDRQPNLAPAPPVTVRMGVRVTSVRYDPFDAKMTTGLALVASWTDNSLAWDPNKFNGTTRLTFRQGQIWRPTFFVFNSDDMGVVDSRNPELISLVHSGEATLHIQTKLNTWCFERSGDYNRWPHDEYSCSLIIGPWEAHEKIRIEEISPNDSKMTIFTDIDDVIFDEWDVTIKKGVVSVSVWNLIFVPQDNHTYQSDRLILNINLQRRATTHNIVFYTPLLVLVTYVLLSFWTEPLKMSRVYFYVGAVTIICMGLCYIDSLVPCHTVPSILVLYSTVLMGILVALLIQVLLMTSMTDKVCKSKWTQAILTAKWFRIVCCLPTMKIYRIYDSINEAYDTQEDEYSEVIDTPRNGNIEQMQTDKSTFGEKEELAGVIDKFMFVTYSLVFAIMLSLHF